MRMVAEVLSNLFRRASTILYPQERREPPNFRGRLGFDREKCIGCRMCWRVCPASAIDMVEDERGPRPVFKLYRCIYCYQCVEVCPVHAIIPSKEYENVALRKEELVVR